MEQVNQNQQATTSADNTQTVTVTQDGQQQTQQTQQQTQQDDIVTRVSKLKEDVKPVADDTKFDYKEIDKIQDILGKVKTLDGLLPICSHCKKIRDDNGCWNQIEAYLKDHSEANFSHGLCPECAKKLYPDFYKGD